MRSDQPLYIVGAGGIGCAVGYFLARAGVNFTFVDADPEKVHWGRRHGVAVDHLSPTPVDFQHFDDWQPHPDAKVLLCNKCYDNAVVLSRLASTAVIIPIQNGFDPLLRERVTGWEGIASFVSECYPHTSHTRITRQGCLHFGPLASKTPSPQPGFLDRLRKTAPFRIKVVPDILPYKYTKLMYNAAISPLAAAAGLDNGDLLGIPTARRLFFALLQENYEILCRTGVALGKIGPFHPHTVARILRRPWVATSLAWAFYPSLRGSYCSMSGDLPRGRTEIDYYNGHLLELAGELPAESNHRVYALVKRMERERLLPGLKWLAELAQTGAVKCSA